MSINFPINNQDITVYTDGLCFTQDFNVKNYGVTIDKFFSDKKNNSLCFYIEEGLWFFPFKFNMSVFSANEIFNNTFATITKVNIDANTFLYLEKEIIVPPLLKNMSPEYYFDVTLYKEKDVVKLLQHEIELSYKGNLNYWKNSLDLIDYIYK